MRSRRVGRVAVVGRVGRVVVVAAAVCGLSGVGAVPADGVQTAKFGLSATGARSKIVHSPSDRPISDGVIVYNRTARPLTISLDVVGVTQKSDGSYSLGAPGTGLARDVKLQTRSVSLPAKGRQTIGVTITADSDVKTPAFAAVTAIAGPASSPGVSVTERLAVLVEVAPGDASATAVTPGSTHKRHVAVIVATVLLLAVLALLIAWFTLRRRRARPTGVEGQ